MGIYIYIKIIYFLYSFQVCLYVRLFVVMDIFILGGLTGIYDFLGTRVLYWPCDKSPGKCCSHQAPIKTQTLIQVLGEKTSS